jgi:preprotein translocase subunit SecY
LSHGRPLFLLLYLGLIVFFAFFYTASCSTRPRPPIISNMAASFRAFAPAGTAGIHRLRALAHHGVEAIYLAIVCLIPEILISYASVPFYFGGVALDRGQRDHGYGGAGPRLSARPPV